MIKSKEDIMNALKTILGDNTSEEALALCEDVSDTFDEYTKQTSDTTNWKTKYEENDKAWRQKYRDRFFSGKADTEVEEEIEEGEKPLTFESLFKEG